MSESNVGIIDICKEVRETSNDPAPDAPVSEIAKEIVEVKKEKILNEIQEETQQIQERTEINNKLNRLKQLLNSEKKDGKVDASDNEELLALLEEVRELDLSMGESETKETLPGIPEGKTRFNAEETQSLLTSISDTEKQLNTKNQMQMQNSNRLWQCYMEVFSLAKEVMTTLKDLSRKIIQGIR